jgi:hypothetical protein
MSDVYLQYHNCEMQGLLPPPHPQPLSHQGARGDDGTEPITVQIHTKVASAKGASGRVLLVVGVGSPRKYFLWSSFTIAQCATSHGQYQLSGSGWQLAPPQLLTGRAFDNFKSACANFIGFRQITSMPYTARLLELADRHQPPGSWEQTRTILREVGRLTKHKNLREQIHALTNSSTSVTEPTIALSIRQPHAEAILRGIKTIEYRHDVTHRRGRIFIYVGKLPADNAENWMKNYGIHDVKIDDLPRGVIVGSVELYGCDGGEWKLREPQRAKVLLIPKNRPQPMWFHPF